ncbi:sigma-54 dependent transcriptional regulator [Sphingobacterium kyonggiense]|uniref:Sigma-54 dependent transcriptional regulator n=2 Tax=Sphingobacterium kyonggiense TaxID=714075 RepID=A0ABP7YV13_9SPHI
MDIVRTEAYSLIIMKKIQSSILVVDDQDEVLLAAKLILKRSFEHVFTLNDPKKILNFISEHQIEVLLLDMNFRVGYEDGKEGIYRFQEVKEHFPHVKIILMTSYAQIERAVEGIKLGAIDYMMKPWDNEKLLENVKQAVQQFRRAQRNPKEVKSSFYEGVSEKIKETFRIAKRVAITDANVLVLGENGTGKYVLAEYIHQQSERKNGPFVHVDLGSLHENLFESELFGYAKGAFTDAKQDKPGRFEAANGGTIFLDEIGNVPLHLQTKLLQVIQSKKSIRLGEAKLRDLDVRIITATNKNLSKAVEQQEFREDLFYRINTISLEIPALRERPEDLEGMIHYFLTEYAEKYQTQVPSLEPFLLEKLQQYNWPGNIRELQNRIERAVIMTDQEPIGLNALGISDSMLIQFENKDSTLSNLEKTKIEQTLIKFQGNISRTAEELGLTRQALYRKLEKYQIQTK